MSCKEVADFLSDYLDGTLPLRQRFVFRLHLLMCRDCRRYLDSYAATVRMARSLREQAEEVVPIPEELVTAILIARGIGNSESAN